jgi:tRNA nucleotidyltransferase (CCA-adding enzyme)
MNRVCVNVFRQLFHIHGFANQVSLSLIAIQFFEEFKLILGFNTFGAHFQIQRMRHVLEWYMRMYLPEEPDLLMLMVIALCRRARGPEVEEVLDRLQFSDKRRRDTLLVRSAIMAVRQGMQRWESRNGSMSDLHRMLGKVPLEALLYLLAREDKPEQHEKLTRYIYQGRQMKADISGADLIRMGVRPGPVIGRILDEVLAAKMDEENMSREAQLLLAGRLAERFAVEEAEQESSAVSGRTDEEQA